MSILVNGIPTKEFAARRELRQGDPLSSFVFVIVAEALSVLVNRPLELGDFAGFNINGGCNIDIIPFIYDTFMVGDGSWKHIWAIKLVLSSIFIFMLSFYKVSAKN